jgi:hypothetical protein
LITQTLGPTSQHPVVHVLPAQQAMPGVPHAPASDASGASGGASGGASAIGASDCASLASWVVTSATFWSAPWESGIVALSGAELSVVPSATCTSFEASPAVASSGVVTNTEKLSLQAPTPSVTRARRTASGASGRRAIVLFTAHLASRRSWER